MAVHSTAAAPTSTSGYTLTIADVPEPAAGYDELDEYCDHVTVRGVDFSLVGSCRLMTPAGAAAAGRRPGDGAFNLAGLRPLRDRLVDVDRFWVHPGHRSGAVVGMMWTALSRYLLLNDLRWVGGCAGVPADDGGLAAAAAWRQLRTGQLAPPTLRVRPRRPWPAVASPVGPDVASPVAAPSGVLPPQLRGPLRLGAWVCGEPAYDAARGMADFYVLLSMDRLSPRHRRHFLGATR